jgi:hypothetical protein
MILLPTTNRSNLPNTTGNSLIRIPVKKKKMTSKKLNMDSGICRNRRFQHVPQDSSLKSETLMFPHAITHDAVVLKRPDPNIVSIG